MSKTVTAKYFSKNLFICYWLTSVISKTSLVHLDLSNKVLSLYSPITYRSTLPNGEKKTSKQKGWCPSLQGQKKRYGDVLGRAHCCLLMFFMSLNSSRTSRKSGILAMSCVGYSNNKSTILIQGVFTESLSWTRTCGVESREPKRALHCLCGLTV